MKPLSFAACLAAVLTLGFGTLLVLIPEEGRGAVGEQIPLAVYGDTFEFDPPLDGPTLMLLPNSAIPAGSALQFHHELHLAALALPEGGTWEVTAIEAKSPSGETLRVELADCRQRARVAFAGDQTVEYPTDLTCKGAWRPVKGTTR